MAPESDPRSSHATHEPARFTIRARAGAARADGSDGAWWPTGRVLSEQFPVLFELWPPELGRIARVLYSPPDWDDRPRSVAVPHRRVKCGSFPRDDTHQLVITTADHVRHVLTVVPPGAADAVAAASLSGSATTGG